MSRIQRIYQNAYTIIIWAGPQSQNSDVANPFSDIEKALVALEKALVTSRRNHDLSHLRVLPLIHTMPS